VKLWNIKTGECVKTWEFPTAVKRVEFSEDGMQLLAVTEKRMGYLGTIVVYDIRYGDDLTDQTDEHSLRIQCERSKATVAAWSYLDKYIIAGHEDGTVSQYDAKVSPPTIPCKQQCSLLTLWKERRNASRRRGPR
jgi:translation initiation factor 3 subunit I